MPTDLISLKIAYRQHHASGSPTVAEYVAALEAELARTKADLAKTKPLIEAAESFAEWAAANVDAEGWSGDEQKQSIHTWFGPSEFRELQHAYEECPAHLKPKTPSHGELSQLVQKGSPSIVLRSPDSGEPNSIDLDEATIRAVLARAAEVVCVGTGEEVYNGPVTAPWYIIDRHDEEPEVNYPGEVLQVIEDGQALWHQRQEALMRARVQVVSEFLVKRNPAPSGGMAP